MRKNYLLLAFSSILCLSLFACKPNKKLPSSEPEIIDSTESSESELSSEPSESSEPEEPVENLFPVKDILSFYETAGLDVVVPAYVSKANDFETDTSDEKAFVACKMLLERGVYVNPVVSPATPVGQALLRTSYTATHTKEQMDKAMKAIKEVLDLLEVK